MQTNILKIINEQVDSIFSENCMSYKLFISFSWGFEEFSINVNDLKNKRVIGNQVLHPFGGFEYTFNEIGQSTWSHGNYRYYLYIKDILYKEQLFDEAIIFVKKCIEKNIKQLEKEKDIYNIGIDNSENLMKEFIKDASEIL
jgi:hypothetical protein